MDLDLSGIMTTLQPVLPILSYLINYMTKMIEIVASYFGFDLTKPEEDETTTGGTEESTTL